MHLITTAEVSFLPKKNKDCLILGNWCINKVTSSYFEGKNYKIFPYHFDDRNFFNASYQYCNKISELMLIDIAEAYQQIFAVSFNKRYWKIVFGPWTDQFTAVLYDRYLSLKNVVKEHPEIETILLGKASFICPDSSKEFFSMVCKDAFNLQIYSFIWSFIGGKTTKVKKLELRDRNLKKTNYNRFKTILYNPFIQTVLSGLMAKTSIWSFHTGFPRKFYWNLTRKLNFRLFPIELFINNLETKISKKDSNKELRKILKKNSLKILICQTTFFINSVLRLLLHFFLLAFWNNFYMLMKPLQNLEQPNLKH